MSQDAVELIRDLNSNTRKEFIKNICEDWGLEYNVGNWVFVVKKYLAHEAHKYLYAFVQNKPLYNPFTFTSLARSKPIFIPTPRHYLEYNQLKLRHLLKSTYLKYTPLKEICYAKKHKYYDFRHMRYWGSVSDKAPGADNRYLANRFYYWLCYSLNFDDPMVKLDTEGGLWLAQQKNSFAFPISLHLYFGHICRTVELTLNNIPSHTLSKPAEEFSNQFVTAPLMNPHFYMRMQTALDEKTVPQSKYNLKFL